MSCIYLACFVASPGRDVGPPTHARHFTALEPRLPRQRLSAKRKAEKGAEGGEASCAPRRLVFGLPPGRLETSARTTKPAPEARASEEAVAFLASIEAEELAKCAFADSLTTASEGGRDLGSFSVSVEFARRARRPCLLLRARSRGAVDDCPCGTALTAYLTADLEVLEEERREYVELDGRVLDKRCHVVRRDGTTTVDHVSGVGEDVTRDSVCYSADALRGLVTDGSNFLLMRLMALRKKVPEHVTFLSFDDKLRLCRATFRQLEQKQMEVDGQTLDVFGVERILQSADESPTTWHHYFLPDGHLASRWQVGSPVTMVLLQLPSQNQQAYEKISLVWEEDIQMRSKFLDRKEELKADHASYLKAHPEIRALISDFLQFLLLKKPRDVFRFAREYFLPFTTDGGSPASPSQ
ncbi:ciliogenesis-associated TTC17-interacting protein [Syngnathoides biaculeatus]|uniref:ciliogenesis-associated TTC17-interacting protein n=1 Tax=Syngnathoides biaculeatus TaxID=300417 RepID=UPI002ADDF175|nr:ciliogenesis-associated TTC17-interacting protein [Syngnathoides biaculeatus]